jgi:putative ABC transport system permease protein
MTSLSLIVAYLRAKPLQALLNVLLLALGVATIVFALATARQLERSFTRDLAGIDLVVGAKGSPLQIILSGVFHLDVPTGNIPLAQAEALRRNPMIAKAIPLSLGDSYAGFRIVGTEPAYIEHYGAALAQGRIWSNTLEAVAGADTAVALGTRFAGVHGLGAGGHAHTDTPYTVVGVLKRCGCVLDRLIMTNLESVWQVHETAIAEDESDKKVLQAEREITLLLLQYKSPMAAAILPRQINSQSELQAASPAFETARLMRMVGTGSDLLQLFGWVLMAASGIALFVAMLGALNDRKADLAMLRMLGAGRGKLSRLLLGEALLLALAGFLLGWLIGQGLTAVLSYSLQASQGGQASLDVVSLVPHWSDLAVLGGTVAVAFVACIAPLRQLYRLDVALTLTDNA